MLTKQLAWLFSSDCPERVQECILAQLPAAQRLCAVGLASRQLNLQANAATCSLTKSLSSADAASSLSRWLAKHGQYVQHMQLSGPSDTHVTLPFETTLRRCSNLQELQLRCVDISLQQPAMWSQQCPPLKKLKCLSLDHCSWQGCAQLLPLLTGLQHISLLHATLPGIASRLQVALSRMPLLQQLCLEGDWVTGAVLGKLRGVTSLQQLQLQGIGATSNMLPSVAAMQGLTCLSLVDLPRMRFAFPTPPGGSFSQLQHLRQLVLVRLESIATDALCSIPPGRLHHLELIGSSITSRQHITDTLAWIRGMTCLRLLHIQSCFASCLPPKETHHYSALTSSPQLRALTFTGNHTFLFHAWPHMFSSDSPLQRRLRHLQISRNVFTEGAAKLDAYSLGLMAHRCPGLQEVQLCEVLRDDAALAALQALKQLTSLTISDIHVSDGASHLLALSSLRSLTLEPPVTQEGEKLACLRAMTQLTHLDVGGVKPQGQDSGEAAVTVGGQQ